MLSCVLPRVTLLSSGVSVYDTRPPPEEVLPEITDVIRELEQLERR